MKKVPKHPELLVFDCDPGCDDAIAIALVALATASPYRTVDLLTVSGNVHVEQTTANACRLVSILKAGGDKVQIAVYRGCERSLMGDEPFAASVHGRDGLGDAPNNMASPSNSSESKASTTMAKPTTANKATAVERLLRVARGKQHFDLLCTGPLTNLATALNLMTRKRRTTFWRQCRRFVVMGGCLDAPGNITHSAEFNWFYDPLAAQMVLDYLREYNGSVAANSRRIMNLVPLDVTERVGVGLTQAKSKGHNKRVAPFRPLAEFLFYALQQYGLFHALTRSGRDNITGVPCLSDGKWRTKYLKSIALGSSGAKELPKFCYLHDPLAAWLLLTETGGNGGRWSKLWVENEAIRVETSPGTGRGRVLRCAAPWKGGPIEDAALGTEVRWLSPRDETLWRTMAEEFTAYIRILLRLKK